MIKLIVFDFDGTLADTKHMLLDIIRKDVGKFGAKLTSKFLDEFSGTFDELLEKIGIEEKVLPRLTEKIEFDLVKSMNKVNIVSGVNKLREISVRKIVLTNSIGEFAEKLLEKSKIDFFDEILGQEDFSSKEKYLKNLIRKNKIKANEIIYVGDRPLDVILARKIGCLSVIVCHKASWSSREAILESKPDIVITKIEDIVKIIRKLNFN
jgi:HAD superfamily hydrolase (TIGR01549 family)